MSHDVTLMPLQIGVQPVFGFGEHVEDGRYTTDCVESELESVHLIQNCHIEGRCGCAFLLVTTNMDVVVVMAPIHKTMNHPGIAVEGKDDRLILRKQSIEIFIRQTVRV